MLTRLPQDSIIIIIPIPLRLNLFILRGKSIKMSDSRRFDAHDPKHGRVGDLCRLLGYASDRKGTPRSMHFLSSKVAKFRKQFVESTEGIELFPLDYQSPEAQLCASSFLVENPHLFKDSEEARAFSWPISPRHDQRYACNPVFRSVLM